MQQRSWNVDSAHPGRRCGHPWCSDCKTRRGSRRGNRRVRHAVRNALHALRKEA